MADLGRNLAEHGAERFNTVTLCNNLSPSVFQRQSIVTRNVERSRYLSIKVLSPNLKARLPSIAVSAWDNRYMQG